MADSAAAGSGATISPADEAASCGVGAGSAPLGAGAAAGSAGIAGAPGSVGAGAVGDGSAGAGSAVASGVTVGVGASSFALRARLLRRWRGLAAGRSSRSCQPKGTVTLSAWEAHSGTPSRAASWDVPTSQACWSWGAMRSTDTAGSAHPTRPQITDSTASDATGSTGVSSGWASAMQDRDTVRPDRPDG